MKVHEMRMVSFLEREYNVQLLLGESVGCACTENHTHRFPDCLVHVACHAVIIECDEHAHRGQAYRCDWRRMNECAISLGKPVHFVRWNPHSSTLDELKATIDPLLLQETSETEWEYYGQFNVTYLGYQESDMTRVAERRALAEQ